MEATHSVIELNWGAWYQETTHRVALPDYWTVDILTPSATPSWNDDQIAAAIQRPVDCPPLAEAARGRGTACLIVDDLARPTPAALILPHLLDQLEQAGIGRDRTAVLVATGTHGMLTSAQIAKKVGPQIAADYRVECHDAKGPLASTGIEYGQRELRINRTFMEPDFRIGVGSVLPHSFAGHSGGAKLVLPGLADVDATVRSHKFVEMGLRRDNGVRENRFRKEAEEIVGRLGFDFCVNVVPNHRGQIVGLTTGHFITAHRRACEVAERIYRTPLDKTYDLLLLNAWPKDVDLVQAENVFVALQSVRRPVVKEGGVLLIASAASEGVGRHGLFAPGGASYRTPRQKRAMGDREIWLYAPSMSAEAAGQVFWDGYPFFDNADSLHAALAARFPSRIRAGVLPWAPMQRLDDLRGLEGGSS